MHKWVMASTSSTHKTYKEEITMNGRRRDLSIMHAICLLIQTNIATKCYQKILKGHTSVPFCWGIKMAENAPYRYIPLKIRWNLRSTLCLALWKSAVAFLSQQTFLLFQYRFQSLTRFNWISSKWLDLLNHNTSQNLFITPQLESKAESILINNCVL